MIKLHVKMFKKQTNNVDRPHTHTHTKKKRTDKVDYPKKKKKNPKKATKVVSKHLISPISQQNLT